MSAVVLVSYQPSRLCTCCQVWTMFYGQLTSIGMTSTKNQYNYLYLHIRLFSLSSFKGRLYKIQIIIMLSFSYIVINIYNNSTKQEVKWSYVQRKEILFCLNLEQIKQRIFKVHSKSLSPLCLLILYLHFQPTQS